jgi:hypothetical protein
MWFLESMGVYAPLQAVIIFISMGWMLILNREASAAERV